MRILMSVLMLAGVAVAGCDSGTDVDPNHVAGSFTGTLSGSADGVALHADMNLNLAQDGESLSGSYDFSGGLFSGGEVVPTYGSGQVEGTVTPVPDQGPSVELTLRPTHCPEKELNFSGSYDASDGILELTGTLELYDGNCSQGYVYDLTVTFSR